MHLLSALQNTQDERVTIEFLIRHKTETWRDGVTTTEKKRRRPKQMLLPSVLSILECYRHDAHMPDICLFPVINKKGLALHGKVTH